MKINSHWFTDSPANRSSFLCLGGNMFAFKTPKRVCLNIVYSIILLSNLVLIGKSEKYRVCVVDGKEEYKRSTKYCPKLDQQGNTECVVALDRLDCLRRIHKGKADFGVFTAEDLVAATNSDIDLLITNELRYSSEQPFEYAIVAVVSNGAGIRSKHDLPGKRYCHPGYGYEADWTRILSNFFESSVVTPQCDPFLSVTENRIKASATFFKAACKAGPWVNDRLLDNKLKDKYPNLCSLCDEPSKCSTQDKYWGRRGSLLCLTDGAGDISWARLEDVKQHFGFVPGGGAATPEDYSLLCPDNTVMPLNTTEPCIWVVKPWSVVAARSSKAPEIQTIISSLDRSDSTPWKSSLLNLIEPIYYNVKPLNPIIPVDTYFDRAKGFLSANSFSSCHPPRTIRICTTSNIETAKCSWLRESAAVYGIEPDLDCLKADNKTHCMMALIDNAADVVMVSPDLVSTAIREYHLETLFYETAAETKKYITVAVSRKGTQFKRIQDLKGVKACFPSFDGVAWHSVAYALQKEGITGCEINTEMANFFGSSCVPGLPKNESDSLRKLCQSDFSGDLGALHCLSSGVGDVAFVSSNSIRDFVSEMSGDSDYPDIHTDVNNFYINCFDQIDCHLSWAPLGQAMVRSSSSDMWIKDTLNVFLNLDGLFGKNFRDHTNAFTMFGRYDGVSNVLFHDYTQKLRNVPTVKNTDKMDLPFDSILAKEKICYPSSSSSRFSVGIVLVFFLFLLNNHL